MSAEENFTKRVLDAVEEVLADGVMIDQANSDALWLVLAGVLVFFMHAGFAMLEAGSVQKTSVANIMFKNLATVSIGAVFYWFFGYAFAYGSDDGANQFIGVGSFAGQFGDSPFINAFWFFQMVFAATAATIVSGAVAGRIRLSAYFSVAVLLTAFVYPVVSHWVWATGGWLSAFTDTEELFFFDAKKNNAPCGMFDFAGSGVVHMVGGVAAFWGATILGNRAGWYPGAFPPHNYGLSTLGTFILWFGWYGFNCGSTLVWTGIGVGQVAVTTTLSPSAAAIMGTAVAKVRTKKWSLGVALNCVLGGLVSITAGCAIISPGFSILVGLIGALVYMAGSALMLRLGVDDPVDAVAVHGFCGTWGVISVALFAEDRLISQAYSKECDSDVGSLLMWQVLGVVSIFAWVSVFAIALFGTLKKLALLKLSEEEQYNVDMTEHGASAYEKMSG